jgi:membrane protease YdiL (CAAX protease family)
VTPQLPSGLTPVQFGFFVVEQLLIVGLVEEFVWRGYLQTKLRDWSAARGLPTGTARATGVGAAAALFALWHVPQRLLVQGMDPGSTAASVLLLVGVGIGFGLLYEATHSVLFVALLHGSWNVEPFVFAGETAGAAPAWVGPVVVYGVPLVVTLAIVVAYRRWVTEGADVDRHAAT